MAYFWLRIDLSVTVQFQTSILAKLMLTLLIKQLWKTIFLLTLENKAGRRDASIRLIFD